MRALRIALPALVLALALAACGAEAGDGGKNGADAAPPAGSKLVFTYRDCQLPMNAEFAPLLETLGEPESYFEAASCAFDGLDKTYTYAGVEIITYPDGEVDRISSIRLLDGSVSTPEGITVGSTPEEVTAAYGEDYQELGSQYAYEDGDARLTVLFEDGAAVSVEYMALNDLLG